jgi:hypothetical protein
MMPSWIEKILEGMGISGAIMTENRQIAAGLAGDVSRDIVTLSGEIRAAIASASQAQIVEMRSLLGSTTIVQRRRKITK